MNEDVKKSHRTQGKYNAGSNKRDSLHKESPTNKDPPGKIPHARKRNSNGHEQENNSYTDVTEDESLIIKYQENSTHSFNELEEAKKPIEIRTPGFHKLSETENGESSILYEPEFLNKEADDIFVILQDSTCWNDKNIVIRGVEYPQPRLVAWYGPFPYTYSGVTLEPAEMPSVILYIKEQIENYLCTQDIKVSFNSVLLNCYRNGKDSVAWHSDDELSMAVCPTIASISLGETRKFEMRRKRNFYKDDASNDDVEKCFINLTHGSLLIMNGCMQLDWQHRVPKEYHDKPMRINLTFRTVYSLDRSPEILSKDVKKRSEKCSNIDSPTNIITTFKEDEFPPLNSTLTSVSLDTREYKDNRSVNCDLSSKNNDTNKSVEDISNEPVIHSCVNDTESWDNQRVDDLIDSRQNKGYMMNKNVNIGDSFTLDSDISNANILAKDQSFDNSMSVPNERSYIKPPMCVAPNVNNVQKTWLDAVDNPVYIQKSNSNLNAYAREFVPICPVSCNQEIVYDSFELEGLLELNTKAINDDKLQYYASALREKVMNRVEDFDYFVKDDLIFLNDLMEETQSLRTQRLITERMHKIVCESLDEMDYSGSFGRYYVQEYSQIGYGNSYRGKGNFRNTGPNRGEMHNRNKRQNIGGGYPSKEDADSSRDVSQRGKINSYRGSYYRRENLSGKRNKNYNTFYSGRETRNYNRGSHHEKFSSEEKGNSNKDYSNQEEFSSKKTWSLNVNCSGQEEKMSGSGSKSSNRDCSNWRKECPNRERGYNQEEISGSGGKNFNRRKNSYRENRNTSTGREYSSQDEIPNREVSQANQKVFSTGTGEYSKEGFSNIEDKNSGKGYIKNRK